MSLSASRPEPELHPLNRGFEWKPVRGPFRLITEEQARSFNERGFFMLEGAIDRATIKRVIDEIDPWEAKVEQVLRAQPNRRIMISEADGISFTVHLVKRSLFLREFSASPLFADLCADLIGPDVRLYWDQAVYKKPEYPKPFPWHQDNGYTFIEPQAYLTCWIALTDATVDNGCPWVIPDGHLRGTLKHRPSGLLGMPRRRRPSHSSHARRGRGSSVFVADTSSHRPESHARHPQDLHTSVRSRRRPHRGVRRAMRCSRAPAFDPS